MKNLIVINWCWKCQKETPHSLVEWIYVSKMWRLALLKCKVCSKNIQRLLDDNDARDKCLKR